ncbi:hypothetical protein GCM10027402_31840 [Arthrobacter monumenti]
MNPPDVGIDDRLTAAEGEGGYRAGGIGSDARELEQLIVASGDCTVMAFDDRECGTMQPERAPGVSEPSPRPHRFTAGLGR